MYYSGIDQHKRDSFITTYDSNGTVVKQMRVRNKPLDGARSNRGFTVGDRIYNCSDILKGFPVLRAGSQGLTRAEQ